MDKPKSLSVKNFLIRKLASGIFVPETTIETIVNHQFNMALEAMQTKRTIEISGFGKFVFNYKRGQKMMQKLLSQKRVFENILLMESISERKRITTQAKLDVALNSMRVLKPKLDEEDQF